MLVIVNWICKSIEKTQVSAFLRVKFNMDTEANDSIEDGEVLDYEPLTRPTVALNNSFRTRTVETHSSDSDASSDSDNDVISHKRRIVSTDSGKNKKYNVWVSQIQTSELMDEIGSWESGLNNRVMDRSRNVESYYFTKDVEDKEEKEEDEPKPTNESDTRKRRRGEIVDLRSKLGRRPSKEKDDMKIHPRYLSELRVTTEDSIDDVTQDITLKLCEEKEDLVLRVVTVLGREKAIDLFNKTKSLEEGGGMMVMNGSRRRTPGGVFLQLIKKDDKVSKCEKNQIFIDDQKAGNKCKKSKAKSHQKKGSVTNEPMLMESNVEEEGLPVLQERKDLVLALKQAKNDTESSMQIEAPCTVTREESADPRQLAVYDDIFDDNPCEIEFT